MAKPQKSRISIFVSFILCCISVAMLSVAAGTRRWLVTDCSNVLYSKGRGNSRFGFFTGEATLDIYGPVVKKYWIVCQDNLCMYSSAKTEEERLASINNIINTYNLTGTRTQNLYVDSSHTAPNKVSFQATTESVQTARVPVLMSRGLWVATIAMLFAGLLFAVVGATFAVINTATTPIEFITGVPGLYVWNGCAAVCALVCVILWGIQYSLNLTKNVLIEDAEEGWTTEGLEHLGYSYWLVVVSVLIHLANCVIIAIGTYERKVKTQYEAPETKPGNIMLY